MDVEVNWLGVLAALFAAMIVGSIWYSKPVFGPVWTRLAGLSEAKMKAALPKAMGITTIVAVITAYVIAYFAYVLNAFFHHDFLHDALLASFLLWVGFVVPRVISYDTFEQRSVKITALTIGQEFFSLLAMGLAIGLVGV